MYYISLQDDDSNKLIYYCRNCGNTNNYLIDQKLCISKTELNKKTSKFSNIINKYTKLDPTIPRINTIKCPNNECPSNKNDFSVPREIMYIRYDDINMKYIYLCCNCDYNWTTN